MKQFITLPFILLFLIPGLQGQKIASRLKFEQGQAVEVSLQMKTTISQQAMGQAIDFELNGSANHVYKITNTTEDNSTLHHQTEEIAFNFDGMGQKLSFDSKNEKDMNGRFGKPIKEILGKTYDMIIDPAGKVLMVQPEKMDTTKMDDRFAIITNMLKDVLATVDPPRKGSSSFFKVLPDHEVGKGDTWTESMNSPTEKSSTVYTLDDITDSTILVSFVRNSATISKAEMMGNESTTTMNHKTTGKIILDKATGIVKEKTATTDSNGSTEVMGNTLPVTSKTTTTIIVR